MGRRGVLPSGVGVVRGELVGDVLLVGLTDASKGLDQGPTQVSVHLEAVELAVEKLAEVAGAGRRASVGTDEGELMIAARLGLLDQAAQAGFPAFGKLGTDPRPT